MNTILVLSQREKKAHWRVNDFLYEHGEQVLRLAYHAALPVILSADLLHLIRINFFMHPPEVLPYTAESELLLSPLCNRIDSDIYEIEHEIRKVLLQGLAIEYGKERIADIASLLWQFSSQPLSWLGRDELERAQQLIALHFLDPVKARQWLEQYESQAVPTERPWFVSMRKEIEWAEKIPLIEPKLQTSFIHGRDSIEALGNNTAEEEKSRQIEMEALLAAYTTPITIKRGDVVEGVIVRIDQDEILVDIGLKSEGVLSTKELPASGYGSLNELHLNGRVLVYVMQPETPDGHALLSLRRANAERQWRIADEQYRNGELLKARVIDYNKGGLIVDVAGIRGFVPISQVLNLKREEVASGGENQETAAKLQSMKDKELQLKIIEINRTLNRLILSERQAVQEWRQRRREELLDELKPGEVRRGIVSNLANFGAFVDLGGADGLAHISKLAWSRVNHPSEVLHVGQEVEVQVLSVDKEKKKIALSIKRAEVDPWLTVEQRYTPGQVVTGTITKIAPFGAFARIEDGIEGLIHLSELTPGMDPKQKLHEGLQLQLRILRIDPERRRLGLSLRQAEEPDMKEGTTESPSPETGGRGATSEMMSLEETSARREVAAQQAEKSTLRRDEGKSERRERREHPSDNPLLSNLPLGDEGETTAIAEAFRAAARQRSKEESESSEW